MMAAHGQAVEGPAINANNMDFTVTLHIAKTPAIVARTMFDSSRDTSWIGGVLKSEFLVGRSITVGGRVRRQGTLLGRRFSYITEVTASETNRKLVMRFVEGPLTGEVAYDIVPTKNGSLVRIRNNSRPRLRIPGMGWFLRRSVRADLRRLKVIVENND